MPRPAIKSMIIGLIGKPSSGKSTFFKAATLANVEISPRPFTTIKPNRGIAYVSLECVDKEFNVQCQPRFGYCLQHRRFVPIDLLDVPGLIPDAHKGSGLGNQFLDDLRQADVLIHIVDISGKTNEQGQITENHDPSKDIQFLEYELDQWYLSILKKGWDKFARGIQQEHQNIIKALAKQLSGLKVSEPMVEESIKKLSLPENPVSWNEQQLFSLAQELRKLSKPMILAANKIDIPGAEENYERIRKQFPQYLIIPCSAESELALREASKHKLIQYAPGEKDFQIPEEEKLSQQQLQALQFIEKNVLSIHHATGIQECLDKAVFKFLEYIAIFPGGVNKLSDREGRVLPDCFLLPKNSTALDFAFKIHADIGKSFVKAIDVKNKKAVGKEHVLKHRDVIEIMVRK